MKAFRTIIAVMSLVSLAVVFTGCPGEEPPPPDVTSPVITVPKDEKPPVVDLGDKEGVLIGVSASDDVDGDVTKRIRVLNALETVGIDTVIYEVSDEAGNTATAKRVVEVSGEKLSGIYTVSIVDNGKTYTSNITVSRELTGRFKIENLHNLGSGPFGKGWTVYLWGDGVRRLKIEEQSDADPYYDISGNGWFISGEALFENVGEDKYDLKTINYKLKEDKYNNPSVLPYDGTTCVRKQQ